MCNLYGNLICEKPFVSPEELFGTHHGKRPAAVARHPGVPSGSTGHAPGPAAPGMPRRDVAPLHLLWVEGHVLQLPLLLVLLLGQPLRVGPRGVVDQGVLEQRAEDEGHADPAPDVDGLRVGDRRQRAVDRGLSRGHGQQGRDTEGDASGNLRREEGVSRVILSDARGLVIYGLWGDSESFSIVRN